MLEEWGAEIVNGFGQMFLNPLLYWTVILFVLTGFYRIKRERKQLGTKVFPLFAEGYKTTFISVIFSIIISIIAIVSGIIMSFEVVMLLSIVTILLSITASTMLLSASYTIGITFILLLILPYVTVIRDYINFNNISIVHFISLAILMGIFLLAEAIIVKNKTDKQTFPMKIISERGVEIGKHELKGLSFIPFFAFIPTDSLSIIAPIWPYFHYGEQSFSLMFIPFIIGFNYKIQGELPSKTARHLSRVTLMLGLIVLIFAFASLYISILAFVSVLSAIIGKEWITYRHKSHDKMQPAYFSPLNRGVKVLATIPESRADRLGILVGETVLKVNGNVVINSKQFYEALQNSGAFFKLDVLDHKGEVRFINSAFYEEDHHTLGIIFPEKSDTL